MVRQQEDDVRHKIAAFVLRSTFDIEEAAQAGFMATGGVALIFIVALALNSQSWWPVGGS